MSTIICKLREVVVQMQQQKTPVECSGWFHQEHSMFCEKTFCFQRGQHETMDCFLSEVIGLGSEDHHPTIEACVHEAHNKTEVSVRVFSGEDLHNLCGMVDSIYRRLFKRGR